MRNLVQEDQYAYEELSSQGWFRLLVIEPAENTAADQNPSPLTCRLEHRQLDGSSVDYEAISYIWGTEDATHQITIDGKSFSIRPHLLSILLALRLPNQSRTVWVDAVCINQRDVRERNHQVLQMNAVYAQARQVNVWLGEADECTLRGIRFLELLHAEAYENRSGPPAVVGSTFQRFGAAAKTPTKRVWLDTLAAYNDYFAPILSLLEDPAVVDGMDEAIKLLSRPWWRRMWTLQESVLCPTTVCWCGHYTFPIHLFYSLSYFTYFSVNFDEWRGKPLHDNISLRAVWRAADLTQHMARKGHIGLSLALDSTWSRACSDPRDKVIGLLGLIGPHVALAPQYSWPVHKVYRVAMRAALVDDGTLHCLGFLSDRPGRRNPKLPSWVPDFEIHSAPGSDYITSLSKPIFQHGLYDASLQDVAPPPVIQSDEDDEILPNIRAFWRTVLVDLRQGSWPKPSSAIGPQRLDRQDDKWLDEGPDIDKLVGIWAACGKSGFRQLRLIEQLHRRFFITTTGYYGLGPGDLRPGDRICVFLGGAVAYAVRDGNNGTCKYLGECYVHGAMDGEIIREVEAGKQSYQTFRIR
ncbi:heterokaryon incompatibility protein-domain-containing protein [Dactylonectria macrodidyma]|uniref:Heterokaryon incompatibility protein-domain-containing protein n=1 Tax=Dactylonectria macrodidyma TaxID=307937 RepID=A0A9P9IU68_9HYPO|nr:heterokaryon incompatibility protein-domain-containing protein [Dactylonectria macrodidyma]